MPKSTSIAQIEQPSNAITYRAHVFVKPDHGQYSVSVPIFVGDFVNEDEAHAAARRSLEQRLPLANSYEVRAITSSPALPVYDHTEHGAMSTPNFWKLEGFYETHDKTRGEIRLIGLYNTLKQAQAAVNAQSRDDGMIGFDVSPIEHNAEYPYRACVVLPHGEIIVVRASDNVQTAEKTAKRWCKKLGGVDWFIDTFVEGGADEQAI